MTSYDTGVVTSRDGTRIGFRRFGAGPPVILLHGGMLAAQNLMSLGRELSDAFTVHLVDRRGRGLSGPHGDAFHVDREVQDVQALVGATGATRIFGLSSGGLVALRTALVTPSLARVAVYEPPLSVDGSAPTGWLARFDREVAEGRLSAALTSVLKGLRTEPAFTRLPRAVLVPLLAVGSRLQGAPPPGDVPISALVPTMHYDMQIVREMDGTAPSFASLSAEVLLLGGSRGPAYLRTALDALGAVLPRSRRVLLPGLGHSGPVDAPTRVAPVLREFFSAP